VRSGYRQLRPLLRRFERLLTLERLLIGGSSLIATSIAGFVAIAVYWTESRFAALPNTLPLTLCAVAGATGSQTIFGAFLLAIIAGHEVQFVPGEATGRCARSVRRFRVPMSVRSREPMSGTPTVYE